MARFTLLVAANLYGNKVNLELTFPSVPSIAELDRLIETTFAVESSVLRPPSHPFVQFKVTRCQIFDDRLQQWVDLVSSNQLVEFAQIYAFQKDTTFPEQQSQIPAARLPTATRMAMSSPNRQREVLAPPPIVPSRIASLSSIPMVGGSRSPPRSSSFVATTNAIHTSTSFTSGSTPVVVGGVTTTRYFPDGASHDTKVRTVFEELDINQNRVIEMEEFRRAFRVLNIDLSTATVSDLFSRGDSDRDGVISLNEFQQFAINYPTLVDSFYFRSKEFWEDQRKKQAIEAQAASVEAAKLKEEQSKHLHIEAQRDLENQEKKVALTEAELQAKLSRERDCRQDAMEAKKITEQAHFERGERERDLAAGRDRERQRHVSVVETQRGCEQCSKKVANQEGEVSRSQEKERQLEALLAEARRETERQMKSLQAANGELSQWRDREAQALGIYADAQREVHRLQDNVAATDMELARRTEKEREAEAFLSEAQRDTARASHRRDEEERELQLQREREVHHSRILQDTLRAAEDCERLLHQLEQDHAEYLARRQQIEAQELPLLEQEIRLREQRFNLEEKEIRLRSEAASFQNVSGRSSHEQFSAHRSTVGGLPPGASPFRSPPRR